MSGVEGIPTEHTTNGENMAQTQMIRLEDIRTDGKAASTQLRVITNQEVITEYANALVEGAKFGPVELVPDGKGGYFISDGWHRVGAYRMAGKRVIPAQVLALFPGCTPLESAIRHALRANGGHGLRLTSRDQGKRAEAALMLPELRKLTNRQIRNETGISHQTVGRVRARLVRARLIPHPVTGRVFDDFCPSDYAGEQAFNSAFPEGPEGFDAACDYLRKLSALDSAAWSRRECDDEGETEIDEGDPYGEIEPGMIIHKGLVEGQVLWFTPEHNPVNDGLPTHYGSMDSPDGPLKSPNKKQIKQWALQQAEGEPTAREHRVYATLDPERAAVVQKFLDLMTVPGLGEDLAELVRERAPRNLIDANSDF